MAETYALLSKDRWHGTNLAKLVRHQLAPYATDANTIINGQGQDQDIELTAEASQVLAMALHELATNASKYGALSTPHGRVEIDWNRAPSGNSERLFIEWREIGGPSIAAPPKSGYGIDLMRDLVQRELGGTVALEFASTGVCCKIEIPLEAAAGLPVARS